MSSTLTVRVDPGLREAADEVFRAAGISTEEAVRKFLRAAVAARGMPFEIEYPLEGERTAEGIAPLPAEAGAKAVPEDPPSETDVMRETMARNRAILASLGPLRD